MPEVVDEPRCEEDRDAGEDPAELAAPLDRADREGGEHAREEAGEDADAAEQGRLLGMPALARRDRDEPRAAGERRRAQRTATVTGNAAIATIASTARKG